MVNFGWSASISRPSYPLSPIQQPPTTNMATSAYPSLASQSPMTQMVAHASLKMAQALALISPPLHILVSIRRGQFSVARLMRSSTRNALLGAGLGAALGYGRLMSQPEEAIIDRCERLVRWALWLGR